jgi:hypothetical protein
MPADRDVWKCYDPTDGEYYYGYDCTIVSTGQRIPIAAEFTESKQTPEETAMRVTRDALAVATPLPCVFASSSRPPITNAETIREVQPSGCENCSIVPF